MADLSQSSLGTLPASIDSEIEFGFRRADAFAVKPGEKPGIVFCAKVIEEEYRAVQGEMNRLLVAFYKEYPTRLGRRGYTMSPRKAKGDANPYKIFWRRFYLRNFPTDHSLRARKNPLDIPLKKSAQFEFGKKRYTQLPKSFWEHKELRPKVKERFEYYNSQVALLNKKAEILREMFRRIRAMHQSIQRNSLFKKIVTLKP